MRTIVYGVGAVGGVVAGGMIRSGQDCIGIARGGRLDAIRQNGLTLRWPEGVETVMLPCVGSPSEIDWRPDDAILLVMKSQQTQAALHDLRAADVTDQPIFCTQNGVANEQMALRFFPNVHGVNVMLPAEYVALDEAVGFCSPCFGVFDIGRFPSGADAADDALAAALTKAGIMGCVTPDVMVQKYGKLILNLGNIVEAALGRGVDADDLVDALRDEGRQVLRDAGIAFADVGKTDPRREQMKIGSVEGAARVGSSTTQSLMRGAGSIETDYLNGEIAMIARLHGQEAPINAAAACLASELAASGAAPGSITREVFLHRIGLA